MQGGAADLGAVNGATPGDAGVEHGARLVAFTEAVMGADDLALDRERRALRSVLAPGAFVDVCAVVGMFNVVDRIADATGIPLDEPLAAMSAEVRSELDLERFPSAANSRSVLGR
jgi:alkylhydroperoxidase family enzyme